MLISGVSEDEEGRAGRGAEYQTADELFELMAKDHSYDINDVNSLSARDLIILYKNIDVGTKLMSNGNDLQRKTPNQHVETVIYKDEKESDDSDVSEIYSNEDLHDMFLINNERIDLMNNMSCIHNLCHKVGDVEIQASNLSTEYDRKFLFKDPYIKKQLKNINIMPEYKGIDTVLPVSLLDYICCKRLEDNYNFYMDNIIRYVQNTIEQLKRISNGDYLSDRAREKWKDVAKDCKIRTSKAMKVLTTSDSIPLHVEGKVNGHKTTWDDIVHSEVDIRTLSRILEKKIIIEIPKLICGSYRLFTKRHAENLIISCKKDLNSDGMRYEGGESRVDVLFQLKRSESGHVISNINSIMVLQNVSTIKTAEPKVVQYQEIEFGKDNDSIQERVKIVEIDEQTYYDKRISDISCNDWSTEDDNKKEFLSEKSDCSFPNNYSLNSNQSIDVDKGLLNRKVSMKTLKTETDFTTMSPDELRCTIQRLNMQAPVLEESDEMCLNKKKSPTRVRIKSPYENKSFFMEERKRKKLLEIREKREKKKMALGENCKITKHKYGKGAVMAQPSSSMTKLSITNKSFYNSIYGESLNHDVGMSKKLRKWQKKESDMRKNESENKILPLPDTALDKNTFDDDNTETVMQIQQNLDTEKCSTPIFTTSNYDTNISLLSQLTTSSGTDYSVNNCHSSPCRKSERNEDKLHDDEDDVNIRTSRWSCNLVPVITSNTNEKSTKYQDGIKRALTPVECRKSIDKIYDLMKKLEKVEESDITNSTRKCLKDTDNLNTVDVRRSSTIQISDSGTSVKHHVISSNPSYFSFDKNSSKQAHKDKKTNAPVAVVPKVIISSKIPTSKVDSDRIKADRKRNTTSPSRKVPENPLKAISQLLHEFDSVQRTRQKAHKKIVSDDGKTISRLGSSKKPRKEQFKESGPTTVKVLSFKEQRSRSGQGIDTNQLSNQIMHTDERYIIKGVKRNITDIIDEAREARGEAVRGPSKPYSRLNILSQPKKSFIQGYTEQYQSKTGRNTTVHRVQRSITSTPNVEKNLGITNSKNKRKGPEAASVSAKPALSTAPPIDRITKPRRSASNSPVRKRLLQPTAETYSRQINVPETPENLKKKMVAVASYVKNHYGPIDTSQLFSNDVQKSRVPLIPNDIELASMTSSPIAEESTALGNKIHYMIDTMISTNAPCLSVLAECRESTSKLSNDGLQKASMDSLLKVKEPKSESDYTVDIFEDKNIETAVASVSKNKINDKAADNNRAVDAATYDVQPFNSATELRKLENALYKKISVGAFPKRLRIKNLTLTPKQSRQQVIVIQSGDAGSLLVKSSVSQSLKISESKTDSLTAIKPLTVLSNTHSNWGLTNIPVQVTTVGYGFPTFTSVQNGSIYPVKRVNTHMDESKNKPSSEDVNKNSFKSHKTSQCFKGVHTEFCLEQSTQADFKCVRSTCNVSINKLEQKVLIENKSEQPICEKCENTEDTVLIQKVSQDVYNEETINNPQQNVDHSTSLGILLGLLNEIRKITGETDNSFKNVHEKITHSPCRELEIILNNCPTQESSVNNVYRDLVSVTSLDKLKEVGSNSSIYSFKLLKSKDQENENFVKNVITLDIPQNVCKEVSVSTENQCVNRLTDAPSCFFPITANNTSVTNSVIQIITKPSTHSVYSIAKHDSYCNLALDEVKTDTSVFMLNNKNNVDHLNDKKYGTCFKLEQYAFAKVDAMSVIDKSLRQVSKISNYNSKGACLAFGSEFDIKMKFKRDVLVTVYSILVFTVFAALSFAQIFLPI